jgi:hypothetical protein
MARKLTLRVAPQQPRRGHGKYKKNALENALDALENRNISGAQAGAAVGVVVGAGGAFPLPLVIPGSWRHVHRE